MSNICVVDYDFLKYTIGGVSEKRSVVVTHNSSGNQKEFETRTQFYGNHHKKSGGWLAEQNKNRSSPWLVSDFTIEDKVTPLPLIFATKGIDNYLKKIVDRLGVKDYYGYLGKGDSWRVEASTIIKYKGSRAKMRKPIHLRAIEEHIIKNHNAEFVEGIEVDDKVVMDCTEDPSIILVGIDKDYRGCELTLYNPDHDDDPMKIKGFGSLYPDKNGKVTGHGRVFLYHQVMYGDGSDEYWANSASVMKWGEMSSYKLLKDCKNDKQAFECLVAGYKKLYPKKSTITGWRGDKIEVDWLYVMQENFTMAHMLRHANDHLKVEDILKKLKVKY